MDTRIQGYNDTRIHGYIRYTYTIITRIQGTRVYKYTSMQGYNSCKDTWIQGYKLIQWYEDTRIQEYKDEKYRDSVIHKILEIKEQR